MKFLPSRLDGRSDRQIAFDLMRDAEPETMITFATLTTALQSGVAGPIDRQRVCAAMRAANRTLMRESRRAVVVVRGEGYRVIPAHEHIGVAMTKRERASTQMRVGLVFMRSCRLDELSPEQRKYHEGHTLTMAAVVSAIDHLHARQGKMHVQQGQMAKALSLLAARVEKLEGSP